MNINKTATILIAMVAMISMTGLAMAGSDTTTTYNGDGSYDMTYTGSGGGYLYANTFTTDGFDNLAVNFDADMSGQQSMTTSGGWTVIDRNSRIDNGYGIIMTASGIDPTVGVVKTLVDSDNYAKLIDQDVDIKSTGVYVVSYQAAASNGGAVTEAYGGTTEGKTYTSIVDLGASDHSVLYTDASAEYGESRVDFDTDVDSRGLLYGGTTGDGQLIVYTNTEYNFGQELGGTYDSTTFTFDVNDGYNGQLTTIVDFDSTCDVDGYGATAYWYTVNI